MHLYQIRKLNNEADKLVSLVFKEFLVYVSQEKYLEFFSLKEAALSLQLHISMAESTESVAQKMINLNMANVCVNDFKKHLISCVDMGYIREPQQSHFFNTLDEIVELLGIYRRSNKFKLLQWDVHFEAETKKLASHREQPAYKPSAESVKNGEKLLGAAENPIDSTFFTTQPSKIQEKLTEYAVPPIREYIDNLLYKWREEVREKDKEKERDTKSKG